MWISLVSLRLGIFNQDQKILSNFYAKYVFQIYNWNLMQRDDR